MPTSEKFFYINILQKNNFNKGTISILCYFASKKKLLKSFFKSKDNKLFSHSLLFI